MYKDNKTDRPVCWDWETPLSIYLLAAKAVRQKDVEELLYEWNSLCSVCGVGDRELVLDHDHDTWLIRGLLCVSCNNAEVRSSAVIFTNYRHLYPAFMLGLEVKYTSLSKWSSRAA